MPRHSAIKLTLKLYGWPFNRSGDMYAIVPVKVLALVASAESPPLDRSFTTGMGVYE